jgi:hemoglobin
MTQTIYERYGGFPAIRKMVSAFYDKVLDSPRLQRHFAATDMRRLIDHQIKFVAQMMQGPAAYSDDQLRRVHERLGITRAEFEETAELLCETLEDFGVEAADVDHVREEIRRREPFIVARPG